MRSRPLQALAASVAIAAVALPLTINYLRSSGPAVPSGPPADAYIKLRRADLPGGLATVTERAGTIDGRAAPQTPVAPANGPAKSAIGGGVEASPAPSVATVTTAAQPSPAPSTRTVQTGPIGRDQRPVGQIAAVPPATPVPGMILAEPARRQASGGGAKQNLIDKLEKSEADAAFRLKSGQREAALPMPTAPVAPPKMADLVTDPAGRPVSPVPPPPAQHAYLHHPNPDAPYPRPDESRDRFPAIAPAPFKRVAEEPVSTFSADVDTASYAFVRRSLNAGRRPPPDAVRLEEMLNYFPYAYPRPESASQPFLPTVTVVPAPWNAENRIVHIAIKGYELNAAERPRANLVLLVDISGSMSPADRLPLLKSAFRMLIGELKPDDTVSVVTYASNTRVALEPTRAADTSRILGVIESLVAGGGTYGEGGLQLAYRLAEANFDKRAVNRVILATDGDFNIGISDHTELKTFIEGKRQTGIFLSVLGVGLLKEMGGNHNDRLMQALAQNGNGVAAYIDTLSEARKVLVEEASSSLFPIAKDVKIQLEFNPAKVSEYRLLGYETRALRREDFNNDKVDAGDVGSGHAVTAIYEIVPVGARTQMVDGLRYGPPPAPSVRLEPAASGTKDAEYGFLKLRYKLPAEETSKLIEVPLTPALDKSTISQASDDVRFGIAIAAFGQLVRGEATAPGFGWDEVMALATGARGADPFGYRAEAINLMRLAKSLPR